jgi:hypothetical protein
VQANARLTAGKTSGFRQCVAWLFTGGFALEGRVGVVNADA